MLIQTALVEAFCAHNIETKDIVSCYVSNNVTLLNYDANMNMIHERPQAFIEMCFSWYWWNVSQFLFKEDAKSLVSHRN